MKQSPEAPAPREGYKPLLPWMRYLAPLGLLGLIGLVDQRFSVFGAFGAFGAWGRRNFTSRIQGCHQGSAGRERG